MRKDTVVCSGVRIARRLLALQLLLLQVGCAWIADPWIRTERVTNEPPLPPDASRAPMPQALQQACTALGWVTCHVHEYYDDQRLDAGFTRLAGGTVSTYGPYAKVIPSPHLSSENAGFSTPGGVHVALLFVDTTGWSGPLPITYRALGLAPDVNCVYLRNVDGVSSEAIVAAALTTGGTPCPAPSPDATRLSVQRQVFPQWSGQIPPVARFAEDSLNRPYFGLRCGDGWCTFKPAEYSSRTPPHAGVHANARNWAVPGWYDFQRLAASPPGPGGSSQYALTAGGNHVELSVIGEPGAALREREAFADFVHVATVYVRGSLSGTAYAERWHFSRGINRIFIKADGTDWQAELRYVRNGVKYVIPLQIRHYGHDVFPPPVARWRWDPGDEGIWVACTRGCCRIDPT